MGVQTHRPGKWRISAVDPTTGKRKTKVVEADSVAAARVQLVQIRVQLGRSDNPKLSEAWRYVLERGSRREVSCSLYRRFMELYADPTCGGDTLDDIDGSKIDEACKHLATSTHRQVRRIVKALVREACIEWRIEYRDPFRFSKAPRELRKRHNVGANIESLRKIAREGALPFRVAINCGLRPAELRGLKVEDIDGELVHVRRSRIYLHGQYVNSLPKTGRTRTVRIGHSLASDLASHLRDSSLDSSSDVFKINQQSTFNKHLRKVSCSGLSVLRVPLFALEISVAAIHLEVTLDQFVSVSLEVLSDGRALPLNDEQLGLEPFEIKPPKCLQFVALDIHRQEVHFGDPLAIEKVVQCGLRN